MSSPATARSTSSATARCCARAAWSACAAPGLAFDGLHYVDSVTHNIKPGEYKQSFVAQAQRADREHCRWCPPFRSDRSAMNEREHSSSASIAARSSNNVDPHADRAPAWCRCPTCPTSMPVDLGDAVPAVRRDPVRLLRRARRSARRCGSSSSRATRTIRSGPAASGDRRPKCRRWRWPAPPACSRSCSRPSGQNTLMISDMPGPTGGILLKTTDRRDDLDHPTSASPSATARARPSRMTGPPSRQSRQRRRAGGDLTDAGLPAPVRAPPCCACMAVRRMPTVPNPRVTLDGHAVGRCSPTPWIVAGCPVVPPAAAALRHRAVDRRHHARHLERAAAGRPERPGDLRTRRHAAAAGRHADPGHRDVRRP